MIFIKDIFKKELKNLFFTEMILESKKRRIENEKFGKMKIKKIYFNTIKVTCDKNIEELYYLLKNNSDDFYFLIINEELRSLYNTQFVRKSEILLRKSFFNLFGKNKIYIKEPIEVYPFNVECAIETLLLYN